MKKEDIFMRLYTHYKMLALNMFTWENLPPNLESRHIEKFLYEYGQVIFYDNSIFGKVCLPCSPTGALNVYSEPTSVVVNSHLIHETVYLSNSELVKNKGVRILNNDLILPTDFYIRQYAEKMAEVEYSIDINVKQQKFPFFVETDKKNEYTMKQAFKQKDEGQPYIYAHKNLGIGETTVHTLNVPYVVDKLNEYKYELEREILTFLGLNNTVEKEERLLVDEVNSNNDFIERNVEIMFKNRQYACELINKIFGTNIRVVKNNTVKGGEEDGEIHARTKGDKGKSEL